VASPTKIYMTRVRLKTKAAGRKRKNRLANHGTTPTKAAFFGDIPAADSAAPAPAPHQ
jgi:hypothetical protein